MSFQDFKMKMQEFEEKVPDFFRPWVHEMLVRVYEFEGKTDLKTFWLTVLNNMIIGFVVGLVLGFIPILGAIVSMVYSIAIGIDGIALCVRRLRDAGYHWAFMFLALVPCIGGIALIVLYCMPSKDGGDIIVE